MLPLYGIAVNGMRTAQQALDITADNISNANTQGFSPSDPSLGDLLYQFNDPRVLISDNQTDTSIGAGSRLQGTPRYISQGPLNSTGNPLDVALTSTDNFLQVQLADGTIGYTRAGDLRFDAQGRLHEGDRLIQPPITLPAGAQNPEILPNGQVMADIGEQLQVVGQIQLARFRNTMGLQNINNTTFGATPASGAAMTGLPGEPGFGTLQPGMLEASRVDLGREMAALIISERSFDLNSRALQSLDRIIGDVTHR
jgi:flagellar basal-body rod protein FlgG